ncbi:MAG: hypothetical protein Q8L79_05100 [Methylobacter sp.]|uniref:hypothetical protein n=1 Tax=Methylobacter sp. TaxID=2051955 RepID=UPI00272FADC0|nr:hypothetical protein [Methylobacter sp.]MDP1664487.1 hypothetical protein [Methylobacter sp.]
MALQSDSQGFLTGNPVDLSRAVDQLKQIRIDVRDIKRSLLGAVANVRDNNHSRSSSGGSNARNRGSSASGQSSADNSGVATPNRPRSSSTSSSVFPPESPGGTVIPNGRGRDASGRFSGNRSSGNQASSPTDTPDEDPEDKKKKKDQSSFLSNVANSITTAVKESTNGVEEADPTIKAFQEVAEPMRRGYEIFTGGGGDKKERWYKKIFKELNLFRKDESVFNRAANRSLHNIEDNPGGGGDGDQSFLGGLLGSISPWIMAAITGLGGALLTGIGSVLGIIFSPIGLAIGAASAIAWGLFTESGQKFFGEVGAKLIAGWDVVVTAFAPITESIGKGWDTVKGGFDSLINGMVSSWDAFTGFLKDKFGIDIPAILKPVVDAGEKAVEATKETVNAGADIAKNTANEAVDAVQKSSPKTTEALGNAWDKIKEGASNISRRAKFNEVEAALNFQGGDQITGLSDVQTRALAANTSKTESGGKIDADNKQGYFGQYQFGAEALVESGLVKQDKLEEAKKASGKDWYKKRNSRGEIGGHEAFLRDKSNWNTEGGLDSFLQDKGAQDKAFVKYTNKNVAGGIRSGAISNSDSAEKIAGYSKAAHLKGVGGANKLFKNGIESTDGNGTSTATYAKQAATAMTETVDAINAKLAKDEHLAETPAPAVASTSDDPTQGGRYNAINANYMPLYHQLAAGPVNTQVQTASTSMPKVPTFAPPPPIAEAPPIIQPLGSDLNRSISVNMPAPDVGQDVRDRGIAHIVTGGMSGRG